MKLASRVGVSIASVLVASGSIAALSARPSVAQMGKVSFSCETIAGTPVTLAKLEQGERQFIRWISDVFIKPYTPIQRCQEVTGRLNTYFNNAGRYITSGRMNNQPVICITDTEGNGCKQLLYTLKPGQNAKETLEDLFTLNSRNFAGRPLREAPCPTYVSIDAVIEGKQVVAREVCSAR